MPALGHEWGDWKVTKPATDTEEGIEERTCARCGATETRAIPVTLAYRCVSPEGIGWTKGSSDALTLTFKRSRDDDKTFGLFTGIKIDGVGVPAKSASGAANYTVESGSLVLNLQPSYLETLSVGDHTVTAFFEDGSSSATFAVKAASKSTESKSANTGDRMPVVALGLLAALAALAVVVAVRRKHA